MSKRIMTETPSSTRLCPFSDFFILKGIFICTPFTGYFLIIGRKAGQKRSSGAIPLPVLLPMIFGLLGFEPRKKAMGGVVGVLSGATSA